MNTPVMSSGNALLTINGGSSSLRFGIFTAAENPQALLRGKIAGIGSAQASLTIRDSDGGLRDQMPVSAGDHAGAIQVLSGWLLSQHLQDSIIAIGHRVVHGMQHSEAELITPSLMVDLRNIMAFDPEHMPFEIALIEALQQHYANLPQVACFDTAFHRNLPVLAKLLPIPYRYRSLGVERYGFHGLSYTYLLAALQRAGDPAATSGRVILAHLGNGASVAAVRDGQCIDTSMGFTPTGGLMMGTRSGDVDPGLLYYLACTYHLDAAQLQHMVNHESGLLGVSGSSGDMRELLAREAHDSRAAEAVALYCYQAKKWLGSFAAALGGVDTIVFAGGIGEAAAEVRARICAGLNFLGVELDQQRNAAHAELISTDNSWVNVRVIATDEEMMIAQLVKQVMNRAA